MREIFRNQGQEYDYREFVKLINEKHGIFEPIILFDAVNSLDDLKKIIKEELIEFFSADLVEFIKEDQKSPFDSLTKLAICEKRTFCLNGRELKSIFVTAPRSAGTTSIFEVSPKQFNITPKNLPSEYQNILVVPFSYGKEKKITKDGATEVAKYAALVIAHASPDKIFDPPVDIPIANRIAVEMGIVMHNKKFSF
ncbi:MAG: hypothetical protein ACPL4K_02920 [Candidatus Margulisiibacteriota bacterium]